METMFDRTENLLGKENVERLKTKNVIVFGIGGVGGYVVEMLARAGVENILASTPAFSRSSSENTLFTTSKTPVRDARE